MSDTVKRPPGRPKGSKTRPKDSTSSARAEHEQANGHPATAPVQHTGEQAPAPSRMIPLDSILPSLTNPRKHFDQPSLEALAESIRTHGVLQPVLVRPVRGDWQITPGSDHWESAKERWYWSSQALGLIGTRHATREEAEANPPWELVCGERRLRAARIAGLAEIPAMVRDLTDEHAEAWQVVENDQRADVSPLERAQGYADWIARRKGQEAALTARLAKMVGVSVSTIRGGLKLLALPKRVREAVDSGRLGVSAAVLIARLPSESSRARLADTAVGYGEGTPCWSYRDVKGWIERHEQRELKGAPWKLSLKTLTPAGSCDECPKRAGNSPDEYPDTRADMCMDPACYRAKEEAWRAKHPPEKGPDNGWYTPQPKTPAQDLHAATREASSQIGTVDPPGPSGPSDWQISRRANELLRERCLEDLARLDAEAALRRMARWVTAELYPEELIEALQSLGVEPCEDECGPDEPDPQVGQLVEAIGTAGGGALAKLIGGHVLGFNIATRAGVILDDLGTTTEQLQQEARAALEAEAEARRKAVQQ